jgi:uncharacterized membrane protein
MTQSDAGDYERAMEKKRLRRDWVLLTICLVLAWIRRFGTSRTSFLPYVNLG